MGSLIKFVAGTFLVLFLLAFTLPLLWLVVKLFVWIIGGLFGGGFLTVLFIIGCIGFIIWCLLS